MRIFKVLFLTCCASVFTLASSQVYYIKAYGDFGKKLSDVAKQYAKDNNSEVEVFVDNDPRRYKDTRLLKFGVNKKASFSTSLGKELYELNCKACHGEKFNKRPSGATPLRKMSAKDIEDSVIAYRNDPEFGGSMRNVMKGIGMKVSNSDLGAIIYYIKGQNAYSSQINQENRPVSTQKKQGSYLR